MKIKISELEDRPLDWAVAWALELDPMLAPIVPTNWIYVSAQRAEAAGVIKSAAVVADPMVFRPTTNWAQGGPLIERFILSMDSDIPPVDQLPCSAIAAISDKEGRWRHGATKLIAAMRAIVDAHTDGEWVEVPDEIVEGKA